MLWIAAGLVGLATLAPDLDTLAQPTATAAGDTIIPRAADGQFYTDAHVGRTRIRMMVDPGASDVLLTAGDAVLLGIAARPGFQRITLPAIMVGTLPASGVGAVVAPDLPVSLLGRSYLDRLTAVEVQADRMVLR